MDPLYDIYFAGEILDGYEPAAVRSALGKLFKADDPTLDKLFSGKLLMIKSGCDKATAMKYKQSMERAGANPVIRAQETPTPPPEAKSTEADSPSAADKIAALAAAPDENAYRSGESAAPETPAETVEEGMNIAPAGTDVLRAEERQVIQEVEVDTSGLAVDRAAERLSEAPEPPPPAPDTSHMAMGEVGETLPILDQAAPPAAVETNHLELSPSGTDFSDCAEPEPESPDLDLSGIDLAPEGSDVLDDRYRKRDEPAAPDTDHISLED